MSAAIATTDEPFDRMSGRLRILADTAAIIGPLLSDDMSGHLFVRERRLCSVPVAPDVQPLLWEGDQA